MDNKRFDTLVKQLAIGADRRRILKGLFGGAAAAVAGGLTRQDTAATLICKYDADCDEKKKCEVCKYGKCEPKCDPKKCEVCDGYGNCKSTCDPKKCEECKNGYCKSTCRHDQICAYGKCVCPKGTKECRGKCIPVDFCCRDEDCNGAQQVCCGPETDKPGKCVGKGQTDGDRACFTGPPA